MQAELDRPDQVGLSHLGFSVSNLERSFSFYCDVLGATLARAPYDGDSPSFSGRMALVVLGALALDLFEHSGNEGKRFDPSWRRSPAATRSRRRVRGLTRSTC